MDLLIKKLINNENYLPRLILCSYFLRALSDGVDGSILLAGFCLLVWTMKTSAVSWLNTWPWSIIELMWESDLTVETSPVISFCQISSCWTPHPLLVLVLLIIILLLLLWRRLHRDITHLTLHLREIWLAAANETNTKLWIYRVDVSIL